MALAPGFSQGVNQGYSRDESASNFIQIIWKNLVLSELLESGSLLLTNYWLDEFKVLGSSQLHEQASQSQEKV